MSDLSPEEQFDLIENAKSRDQRIALISQRIDIESELRDSPTWRYLRHRIGLAKADITTELAELAPTDLAAVTKLQARAISVVSFYGWIDELMTAASAAEDQINIEDGRLPADE